MHVNPRIAALLNQLNNPSLPGVDLSLERMWELLAALGNPQDRLPPVVHFAGTNGKGSTLAFLRAMYEAEGYRVHSYTSPHLVRFNERITLAGREIDDEELLPLLERIAELAKKIAVTFFEATTAMALLAFAEHKADVVLLETGLGGRLDATNVVAKPAATVITPVDFDHVEFLGDTLSRIAAEKAGIIKAGVVCVSGKQQPEAAAVLARVAAEKAAPLIGHGVQWHYEANAEGIRVSMESRRWHLPQPVLLGAHQFHNAALASVVAQQYKALPVSEASMAQGVLNARWPARMQALQFGPLVEAWGERGPVMLDGAHNLHAAAALNDWLTAQAQPVTMICGMMRRKDAVAFFHPFVGHVRHLVAVPIAGEACYSPEDLAAAARKAGMAQVAAAHSLDDASAAIGGDGPGILLVAGSLFLAGEVLKNHG